MSVRIGFIGTGGIAVSHLESLLGDPNAEVVGLCDIAPERVEATRTAVNKSARAAGSVRELDGVAYTDYNAMLRDERLDAVYLCLPPFAHGDPEDAVIAAGLPMLVEKPVGLDLAAAARTLTSIRQRGVIAASGYQLRYGAVLERARELLEGRTVGMVVVMRFGGTPSTPWYHRQDRSGGQLIEMATHQVDMLRYLLGEVRTVYAAAATRVNNLARPDYDIFDVNCMTLTFESGVVGNFANNFISRHGSPLEARGLHIFCDGLTLSLTSGIRASYTDHTDEFTFDDDAMVSEDRAFVRAVAEGRPDLIRSDYASGVRTLAVTLAGDRSARTGQPVDVAALLAAEAPSV